MSIVEDKKSNSSSLDAEIVHMKPDTRHGINRED